jgi:branched-chain amino acid aminotransferase
VSRGRKEWVWLDGRILPEAEARLSATDPGFLHGRSLFETLRTFEGRPFRLQDHLDRLRSSAALLRIPCVLPDLRPVVAELCRRNRLPDARIRITFSAGGHLLVTAGPIPPLPPDWRTRGAELMIVPWRRDARAPLLAHKTTSSWESALAHDEAAGRGCADAIFVGLRGEILEGARSNLFLVLGGRLTTPRLDGGLLPGVTRRVVMELERTRERIVRLKELWKAEEAFLTGSVRGIVPVLRPPGPVTRRVTAAYDAISAGGA